MTIERAKEILGFKSNDHKFLASIAKTRLQTAVNPPLRVLVACDVLIALDK